MIQWVLLSVGCESKPPPAGDSASAPITTDGVGDTDTDTVDPTTDTTPPPTDPTDTGPVDCPPVTDATRAAVVTDIDETLTTSDNEWLTQLVNPFHDPAMRPDADTMMQTYVDKGYRIFYVTARGELLTLLDGRSAREATIDWLDEHGFPYTEDGVFLANGLGVQGDAAVNYKVDVITELQGMGFDMVYAYGNADSDILAFQESGIPDTNIFLVGDLAGTMGVVGITTADAYTDHLPFVDAQPCGY